MTINKFNDSKNEQGDLQYAEHSGEGSGFAVTEAKQEFGGDWTEVKLSMLRDYLSAYTTALKDRPFTKMYIDAFAGTGYREMTTQRDSSGLFAEQVEAEQAGFFDGSARLALQVEPFFDRYVFIERSRKKFGNLFAISSDFSHLSDRMDFRQGDANEILPVLCRETDWRHTRAVLFLDPFGMNVDWSTMEAVAGTKAIDVWILFPIGIGVNRLLTEKPESMSQDWKNRLDRFFGTSQWFKAFYRQDKQANLFGEEKRTTKVPAAISAIAGFYQERLKTLFPEVASNPRYLCNSKQSPMFLFTFAVSNPNPKARTLAMRIAQHILGRKK